MKKSFLLSVFLVIPFLAFCQEEEHEEEHHEFKHHRVSVVIGHTRVPNGFDVEGRNNIIIPSWGLNYEYWFNENWAIGLHNDMEITTYIIERGNEEVLERERPLIFSLVGIYKTNFGLSIFTGGGYEVEQNESFGVFRLGVEYEFEIGNHWDLTPGLIFDAKEDIYNSYTLGLGVGKKF